MSDNFDIDSILNSVTKQDPTKEEAKESSNERLLPSVFDIANNEGTQFRIDPRSAHITGTDDIRKDAHAVTINPEDFRNQVDIAAEKSRLKKILIGFGVVLVLMGLGYLAYSFIPVSGDGVLTQPRPAIVNPNEAVLEQFFPNAPTPLSDVAYSGRADETGVWLNDGTVDTYHLTFAGMEFKATDRTLVKNTDFKLIAEAQVEGEWNGTQIYGFKDLPRSTVFAQGWERQYLEVEGSPVAAVMYMELAAKIHAVVAVGNPDGTGFLIVLPQNLNYASAANLVDFLRVE